MTEFDQNKISNLIGKIDFDVIKVIAVVSGLVYLYGVVIFWSNLSNIVASQSEIFDITILSAGSIFIVFLYILYYFPIRFLLKRKISINYDKKRSTLGLLCFSIAEILEFVSGFLYSCAICVGLFYFIFIDTVVFLLFIIYAFIFFLAGFRNFEKKENYTCIGLLTRVVIKCVGIAVFLIAYDFEYKIEKGFYVYTFVFALIFMIRDEFTLENSLIGKMEILAFYFIISVLIAASFGSSMYPAVKRSLGGGAPLEIKIHLDPGKINNLGDVAKADGKNSNFLNYGKDFIAVKYEQEIYSIPLKSISYIEYVDVRKEVAEQTKKLLSHYYDSVKRAVSTFSFSNDDELN